VTFATQVDGSACAPGSRSPSPFGTPFGRLFGTLLGTVSARL